ncbi:hypothetical protein BCR44DRAFT_44808 [Catenaria anguillulae PL171]|uniref:Uncharacterized protein n=1 Tax=Catenaria anguillulae PL171 TaxID=765915 RepID=A0A1Y2I2N4_9FUNG|nr:hypothetical protein BCR44DRAFT_44808 [Catenaria anguillulae PL171]
MENSQCQKVKIFSSHSKQSQIHHVRSQTSSHCRPCCLHEAVVGSHSPNVEEDCGTNRPGAWCARDWQAHHRHSRGPKGPSHSQRPLSMCDVPFRRDQCRHHQQRPEQRAWLGDRTGTIDGWQRGRQPIVVCLVQVASAAVGVPRRAISNDLTPWAEQGVCLLSFFGSCTANGDPHMDDTNAGMDTPWGKFMSHIVKTLAQKKASHCLFDVGYVPLSRAIPICMSKYLVQCIQFTQVSGLATLLPHLALTKFRRIQSIHACEVLDSIAAVPDGVPLAPIMRDTNVFWRINQQLIKWGLGRIDWAAGGLVGKAIQDYEANKDCRHPSNPPCPPARGDSDHQGRLSHRHCPTRP